MGEVLPVRYNLVMHDVQFHLVCNLHDCTCIIIIIISPCFKILVSQD